MLYYDIILASRKNFNKGLEKTNIFINEPWALVDNNLEIQRYIFRKNGELILSKNGEASKGRWEYLPEAKSLLIEQNSGSLLLTEIFVNNDIMIFRKDGAKASFLSFSRK